MRSIGSISTADGSSLVRMGNTTVVCGIKAEIAEPELDRGDQGFLGMSFPFRTTHRRREKKILSFPVPNVDLPAMCSPRFKPGPPSEEAQVLSNKLNEVFITLVNPSVSLLSASSLHLKTRFSHPETDPSSSLSQRSV